MLATQKQLVFPPNQPFRLDIATFTKKVDSAVLWFPRTNEPLDLQTDPSGTGTEQHLVSATNLLVSSRELCTQRNSELPPFIEPLTYVTCSSSYRPKCRHVHFWTQLLRKKKRQIDSVALATIRLQLKNMLSERVSERASSRPVSISENTVQL